MRDDAKPEWKTTLSTYVDLMKAAGPPGASSNGFNENLALFNSGKCGMWIDATVAASFVTNPKESKVADKVGFALAPDTGLGKRGNWLWAWSLAIPAGSQKTEAAEKFVSWATSKGYLDLVASKEGWANVPPGTRTSLYKNPEYLKAAPFAQSMAGFFSDNGVLLKKFVFRVEPQEGLKKIALMEQGEVVDLDRATALEAARLSQAERGLRGRGGPDRSSRSRARARRGRPRRWRCCRCRPRSRPRWTARSKTSCRSSTACSSRTRTSSCRCARRRRCSTRRWR